MGSTGIQLACLFAGVFLVTAVRSQQACRTGELRLAGSGSLLQGRVEICIDGEWGTVCDDLWDSNDAKVVCNQLGLVTNGAIAVARAYYGEGTGPIYLDDVECRGNESDLLSCPSQTIGGHNCGHGEDAGVYCQPENFTCTDGDLRLVGGEQENEGRVEICFNNQYGTICDDDWDNDDASVVCGQLGFSRVLAIAVTRGGYGPGIGNIYFDDVACVGTEDNITACAHRGVNIHNCGHTEDAGVLCKPNGPRDCEDGAVRLVDGRISSEGRVEICFNGKWGTICDDLWDDAAAGVVCGIVGLPTDGAIGLPRASFGEGEGPIFLDEVQCVGNETSLLNCSNDGISEHNCGHREDASVVCQDPEFTCINGSVQLRDGDNGTKNDGRVEVCYNNHWGTVCDDNWDNREATVICTQLGYEGDTHIALPRNFFEGGQGAIWLDDLECIGNETTISDCPSRGIGNNNCGHTEDASVLCADTVSPICKNGAVRLVGGEDDQQGTVEVCFNSRWGTICDDQWDDRDATVICRQLGFFGNGSLAASAALFGQGEGPIFLDDVACVGNESAILQCVSQDILGTHNCQHREDSGVICPVPDSQRVCTNGDLRLVDGASERQGRVEVCTNGRWGTICDDGWDKNEATVVCRQLGFDPNTTEAHAVTESSFGSGSGLIFIDNLICSGDEKNLLDCVGAQVGIQSCSHDEDVGVMCIGHVCKDGDVRLSGGDSEREGRVEICLDERWGTICDDGWDEREAMVVCRQLGYPVGARASQGSVFPNGEGTILLDEMDCDGTENNLLNCSGQLNNHDCSHVEDAGVACEVANFSCEDGDVRLVNGATEYEGRVEVCVGNVFSSVCDDGTWGAEEATIVCRQLGYNGTALAIVGGDFGVGLGSVSLLGLRCQGNENTLVDCPSTPNFISFFCNTHSYDAGVLCPTPSASCANGDIRLVGGRIPSEGRVEVCFNGHWGSVCHDGWDERDAAVVCSEAGYPSDGALPLGYGDIGQGEGVILLSNVDCNGNESNLAECPHNGLAQHFCTHQQDAAVVCRDVNNTCENSSVRLVGGEFSNEGRLEICYQDHWGTVCDDFFDNTAASIVCQQLGYSANGSIALSRAFFGEGVGFILLDNVVCLGNETNLFDCSHNDISISNCFHTEDVSIVCQPDIANCTNGDIRLVDGSVANEGRVEICINGQWGTVCDDSWGSNEAAIVCQQLNYPTEGAIAIHGAYFGEGTGPIFLDGVLCDLENHTSLFDCLSNDIGSHDCRHSEDVSVICLVGGENASCANGDVRIMDGAAVTEGRVEVCIKGVWGTICGNAWSDPDATVVCKQVGFSQTDSRAVQGFFGSATGPIHLDSFFCNGEEEELLECPHQRPVEDTCSHSVDAGVICKSETCSDREVRLVDGQFSSEGRVEVCLDGHFGTVCDDYWDNADAAVVCNQLGFSTEGAIALPRAFFGSGSGRINVIGIDCYGNETNLTECFHDPFRAACFHFEDAGVLCASENASAVCANGDLRFSSGEGAYQGNIEVCFNGNWGSICHDRWDNADARTVCRLLGFEEEGALATVSSFFGIDFSTAVFLDEVQCNGNESSIFECLSADPGEHDCFFLAEAGAICPVRNNSFECQSGEIRLAGGDNPRTGRVELCINNLWGGICGREFDDDDATVVCNQLGFVGIEAQAVDSTDFGDGPGFNYLGFLDCTGYEESIMDCPSLGLGSSCFPNFPAAVQCPAPLCYEGDVRLVDGEGENEGRVEVCVSDAWNGEICDDTWDHNDAEVVCRQLGLPYEGAAAVRGAFFGEGDGEILFNSVQCFGNETQLSDCSAGLTPLCRRSQSAGVICPTANASCTNGDVRLVDGRTQYEGRVEVCVHGRWGTVCDDLWDGRDATVVCRQLDFTEGYPYAIRRANFGAGGGLIILDELDCEGTEEHLLDCRADGLGVHDCASYEDAGVFCPYPTNGSKCQNGDLRLVDGYTFADGRVEVCIAGEWGSVCGDRFWGEEEAKVICRQKGFLTEDAIVVGEGFYPPSSEETFLYHLSCDGSEAALVTCPPDEFGAFLFRPGLCGSAGVVCKAPGLCEDGEVRLVDGAADFEGRVEICYDNQFGTVCDEGWDAVDAAVVCSELNFGSTNAIALNNSFFGAGVGPIQIGTARCSRDDISLHQCSRQDRFNCDHSKDAGVICGAFDPVCENGAVRLMGGSDETEGRVEVCFAGRWGSVCDDGWDEVDAGVVCRELGFSDEGAIPTDSAFFGHSTGPILIDDTQCVGDESSLFDCPASYRGVHNCRHIEDAGVICKVIPCVDGTRRLVNGANDYSGRVEVCVGGEWGTVCGQELTEGNANDICNEFNYDSTSAIAIQGGLFGPGSGKIYDYDSCDSECTQAQDCNHGNDAGVICSEPATVASDCQSGDIRLMDGDSEMEGRVEVCMNNAWGTICDDSWDDNSAAVVCNQLGFPSEAAVAVREGTFPGGTGDIFLDDIKCSGKEQHILSCPQMTFGTPNNCKHSEDAGVKCLALPTSVTPCVDGTRRLVNGANDYSGRVEVCVGGEWGTVCGQELTEGNANDICNEFNYDSTSAIAIQGGLFGPGSGKIYDYDSCVSECTQAQDCDHDNDAGVICSEPATVASDCQSGDIRLMDGDSKMEGRVEVCMNNAWGTICDDSWDDNSAAVVCNQLGFPSEAAMAVREGTFSGGTGDIFLDDIKCSGKEKHILSCPQMTFGTPNNCEHSEDAGVKCLEKGTGPTGETTSKSSSNAVAIAVPIVVILIISLIIVTVVIIIAVVIAYRAYRVGKFAPRREDDIPITTSLSFSEEKPDAESSGL